MKMKLFFTIVLSLLFYFFALGCKIEGDPNLCENATQTYTCNTCTDNATWMVTNGAMVTGSGKSATITSGTVDFTINVTDGSNTCTYNVKVSKKSTNPTGATADPPVICLGVKSTLNLLRGGGGPQATIKWYSSSCGVTPVNSPVSPTSTTTYYGRYEDGAPCNTTTDCATVTVTVNTIDPGSITAPTPNTICSGDDPNIINGTNAMGGAGSTITYSWESIKGPNCTGPFQSISGANDKDYDPPSLTETTTFRRKAISTITNSGNSYSCEEYSNCVTITVIPKPSASAKSKKSPICEGSTIELMGLPDNMNYSWDGPNSFMNSSQNPTITNATIINEGTYKLTVTNSQNGVSCISEASTYVKVELKHSIQITPSSGSQNQTVCQNAAIKDISLEIKNSPGATVSGLPAGVTGSYNAGLFIIKGNPTVTGTFNYTVTTSVTECPSVSFTGTIIVEEPHKIADPSTGQLNQTVCINKPITTTKFQISGGAIGVTINGLPTGIVYSFDNTTKVITLSGSTMTSGSHKYTITTSGGVCQVVSKQGEINVIAEHMIQHDMNSGSLMQSVCINTPIKDITFNIGGGATSAKVEGLDNSGLDWNFNINKLVISGKPINAGTINYKVLTSGPACDPKEIQGKIFVEAEHTIIDPNNKNQTICKGTNININFGIGGGAKSAQVIGLDNTGLQATFSNNQITIYGEPDIIGQIDYTVKTSGICSSKESKGVITIISIHEITNNSNNLSQTICQGKEIQEVVIQLSGGADTAIISNLPNGLISTYDVNNKILKISGTPTTSGIYTITTKGQACNAVSLVGEIKFHSRPNINLNLQQVGACVGTSINLNPLPPGGTWTILNNNLASIDKNLLTLNSEGNITLSYKITDSNNCEWVEEKSFTIYPNPIVEIINANPPVCQGEEISLSSSISSGTSPYSYDWGPDPKANTSGVNFNHLNHGTHKISLQVKDKFGCIGIDTTSVTVKQNPVAEIDISDINSPSYLFDFNKSKPADFSEIINYDFSLFVILKDSIIRKEGNPNSPIQYNSKDLVEGKYQANLIVKDKNMCIGSFDTIFYIQDTICNKVRYEYLNSKILYCTYDSIFIKNNSTITQFSMNPDTLTLIYSDSLITDTTIITNNLLKGKIYHLDKLNERIINVKDIAMTKKITLYTIAHKSDTLGRIINLECFQDLSFTVFPKPKLVGLSQDSFCVDATSQLIGLNIVPKSKFEIGSTTISDSTFRIDTIDKLKNSERTFKLGLIMKDAPECRADTSITLYFFGIPSTEPLNQNVCKGEYATFKFLEKIDTSFYTITYNDVNNSTITNKDIEFPMNYDVGTTVNINLEIKNKNSGSLGCVRKENIEFTSVDKPSYNLAKVNCSNMFNLNSLQNSEKYKIEWGLDTNKYFQPDPSNNKLIILRSDIDSLKVSVSVDGKCPNAQSLAINMQGKYSDSAYIHRVSCNGKLLHYSLHPNACSRWLIYDKGSKEVKVIEGSSFVMNAVDSNNVIVFLQLLDEDCETCKELVSYRSSDHTESCDEYNPIKINVFPNPNDGNFTLELLSLPQAEYQLSIINSIGQQIANSHFDNRKKQVEMIPLKYSHVLPSGIYTLLVRNLTTSVQFTKSIIVIK